MKNTDPRALFGTAIGASAAAGNIATIPSTQARAGDGTASVALGFPPETFIARAAGGEPPRGQDMNGLLNLLSSAIQVLQAGYLGPFDAAFAQSIGGYPAGAIVCGATPGAFWVSTADANVSTPGAEGATWQSLFNGYATQAWANGLFATIAQLQAETAARVAADTDLSNNKANLSGGNQFLGLQTIAKGGLELVGNTAMGAASYQLTVQRGDAWRFGWDYNHDNDNGNYSRQIFYDGDSSNVKDILYYFLDKGRLSSAVHGDYALVSDFGVSLASNGYQKLPGGLIIQWGVISSSNGTFNFPITFPNGCFFVLPGNTNAQGNTVDNAFAYPLNASEFFAASKESEANAISGFAMAWIAFGY